MIPAHFTAAQVATRRRFEVYWREALVWRRLPPSTALLPASRYHYLMPTISPRLEILLTLAAAHTQSDGR